MRGILILCLLLLAMPAAALDLTCTVPSAAISAARLADLCEDLRVSLGQRDDAWTNNDCATQFLRIGLRQGVGRKTVRETEATVRGARRTAIDTFDAAFSVPTPASCGDGALDDGSPPGNLNLGEQCDDGNTTPGDGCDENCQTE